MPLHSVSPSQSTKLIAIDLDQSRKRGTLESDLLCSSFASAHLEKMTTSQLQQYDLFLDENDWDIYYWTTQEPSQTSMETAEGGGPDWATPNAQGLEAGRTAAEATGSSAPKDPTPAEREQMKPKQVRKPGTGEWAQTVGTFKPAYRPVPARWRNSEILAMLRKHVIDNSAGGVHEEVKPGVEGEGLVQGAKGTGGSGLGFMPELKPVS